MKKNWIYISLFIILIVGGIVGFFNFFSVVDGSICKKTQLLKNNEELYEKAIEYLDSESLKENIQGKQDFKHFYTYDAFGITEDKEYKYAYLWILDESFFVKENLLYGDSGSSLAYKFTFKDGNVISYEIPKDGSEYSPSIKEMAPCNLQNKILDYDSSSLSNEEKVKDHYSYLASTEVHYEID